MAKKLTVGKLLNYIGELRQDKENDDMMIELWHDGSYIVYNSKDGANYEVIESGNDLTELTHLINENNV